MTRIMDFLVDESEKESYEVIDYQIDTIKDISKIKDIDRVIYVSNNFPHILWELLDKGYRPTNPVTIAIIIINLHCNLESEYERKMTAEQLIDLHLIPNELIITDKHIDKLVKFKHDDAKSLLEQIEYVKHMNTDAIMAIPPITVNTIKYKDIYDKIVKNKQ